MSVTVSTSTDHVSVDAVISRNIDFLRWNTRQAKNRIALALGMSPQSISQKISGQRPWTTTEVYLAAKHFGVSIDALYDPKFIEGGWARWGSNPRPAD